MDSKMTFHAITNKTEKSITVPDSKISSNGETKEPTPWLEELGKCN